MNCHLLAKALAEWPLDDDTCNTLRAAIVEPKSADGTFACFRVLELIRQSCRSQNPELVILRKVSEFERIVFRGEEDRRTESITGHFEYLRKKAKALEVTAGREVKSPSDADTQWLRNISLYPIPISGAEKSLWQDYKEACLDKLHANVEALALGKEGRADFTEEIW